LWGRRFHAKFQRAKKVRLSEMQSQDIFCIPILDRYLLYAPRHDFTALVNRSAVRALRSGLETSTSVPVGMQDLLAQLKTSGTPAPELRRGPALDPIFLGLIPTRDCNMDCRYCDFDKAEAGPREMSIETARSALDAYIHQVCAARQKQLEIHFFGGEPFFAWDVIFFSVEYARKRAAALGLEVRFEVITNGLVSAGRCLWIANTFNSVVLSLDGPAEIQDLHRPGRAGGDGQAAAVVLNSAKILADYASELSLRACVSAESVGRLPEIAAWMAEEFHPTSVCLETLTPSQKSMAFHLEPPDPIEFTRGFLAAAKILEPAGIETVLSTANLNILQSSFCPVGKDALIILPDGSIGACYWQESEWTRRGVNLRLGHLGPSEFILDPEAVQQARDLTSENKAPCAECFCQYHCAGGCHVRRAGSPHARRDTEVCTQTRLISLARLLQRLDQNALLDAWLLDRPALEATASRGSDRLTNREIVS
jgi:uncharacterized protein